MHDVVVRPDGENVSLSPTRAKETFPTIHLLYKRLTCALFHFHRLFHSVACSGRMKEKIRVAFIGAGNLANQVHYPSLSEMEDVELVAISDLVPGKLAETGTKYGIAKQFTDFRDMLDKVECQAETRETGFKKPEETWVASSHFANRSVIGNPTSPFVKCEDATLILC
jgi:hypothetical protein